MNKEIVEELRWKKFPVLDEGFICLVDCMGSDAAITQSARVSYGAGTKSVSDDRTLIRHMLRNHHTSPFEMAEIKLLVRVPMDCWRQWIRHRTASIGEYSTRYSEAIDVMSQTKPDQWRLQSAKNKQGSDRFLDESIGQSLSEEEAIFQKTAREMYEHRLNVGVERGQARKDLPLSQYTEAYWKMDLNNLFKFLFLRMDVAHAQHEICQYATTIGNEIVKPLFPYAWEAFCDYRLNAVTLSAIDQQIISLLAIETGLPVSHDKFLSIINDWWQSIGDRRECEACWEQLKKLSLTNGKD